MLRYLKAPDAVRLFMGVGPKPRPRDGIRFLWNCPKVGFLDLWWVYTCRTFPTSHVRSLYLLHRRHPAFVPPSHVVPSRRETSSLRDRKIDHEGIEEAEPILTQNKRQSQKIMWRRIGKGIRTRLLATRAVMEDEAVYPVPCFGAIHTAEDYIRSLKDRSLTIYAMGEKIDVGHPLIAPSVNAVAETYRLAEREPDVGMVSSDLAKKNVNRFTHVCQSAEEVVAQNRMQRKLGQLTGTCFQRCVGMDAMNATWTVTYRIDAAHGTEYHARFQNFVRHAQTWNLVVGGAMTDSKGDRSKAPHQQTDPDHFVRVVKRDHDTVTLRGCKMHQTGTLNSHYLIVMPGQRLSRDDTDYAIACAVPVDDPRLTYVLGRQSCDTRSMEEGTIDVGNQYYGGQESTIFFDDVVVPMERVFMDGETDFAADLVERFTSYHRRSYVCKAGVGDTLIGAAATIAEMNGIPKVAHIKDKLVEMTHLNETIYATGIAASHSSKPTPAGNYEPDVLLANVCKHHVTRFPYDIARMAQDIAGGLVATLPSDRDFQHPDLQALLTKYLKTTDDCDPEDRRKILRLIENLTLGRNAVGYLTESMHGAGSPQAQRLTIHKLSQLPFKSQLAKRLASCTDASRHPPLPPTNK